MGDNGAASSKENVLWSCLMLCWTFFYHYFIRACCHLHICRIQRSGNDGNETDLELSAYPPTEVEDSLGDVNSNISNDDRMKQRLLRHFCSHLEKWIDRDRPRFPWKATLHILLVALVTGQVSFKANTVMQKYARVDFRIRNLFIYLFIFYFIMCLSILNFTVNFWNLRFHINFVQRFQ